jgi:hypothetical protein
MPAPTIVRTEPQVLLQAFEVGGWRAKRVVRRDCVARFFECGEAVVQPIVHELLNTVGPFFVEQRYDVDEHDGSCRAGSNLALEQHRGTTTE